MDLREAISSRRSIRSFSPQQVDRSVIDRILLDANKAPSAGNLQARDFIVVTAVEVKKKIAERSEEHTSELQSHSFISYAVFCLKKKTKKKK